MLPTLQQNAAETALSGPGELRRRPVLPVRRARGGVLRAEVDVCKVLVQAQRPPIRLWDAAAPSAAVRGARWVLACCVCRAANRASHYRNDPALLPSDLSPKRGVSCNRMDEVFLRPYFTYFDAVFCRGFALRRFFESVRSARYNTSISIFFSVSRVSQ